MSAFLVLKGEELHIGITVQLGGEVGRCAVDDGGDDIAADDARFLCGIIDRDRGSALEAAVSKIDLHAHFLRFRFLSGCIKKPHAEQFTACSGYGFVPYFTVQTRTVPPERFLIPIDFRSIGGTGKEIIGCLSAYQHPLCQMSALFRLVRCFS